MLTSFYSILSHTRLLFPAIRNQEREEIQINSDQPLINKIFLHSQRNSQWAIAFDISPPPG